MFLHMKYGGGPAKLIRKRFDSMMEEKIRNSEWWNQDIEWIRDFVQELYQSKEVK